MEVDLSNQALSILTRLHETGLYGRSVAEVAQRLIYEKLREFDKPLFVRGQCVAMIGDKPRPGVTRRERLAQPLYRCTKPTHDGNALCVLHTAQQDRLAKKAIEAEGVA